MTAVQSNRLTRLHRLLPPWLVMAIGGSLSLLALLITTPPFMFGDEPHHFKRAYGISQLEIWPQTRAGVPGIVAPATIQDTVHAYFAPGRSLTLSMAEAQARRQQPLAPETTRFIILRSDALYPPLAYLPQALAIAMGRLAGASVLDLLYLARLANLLTAVTLVGWALKLLPTGRETMLLVALLPMSQALFASASPDALTLASAMLFAALVLAALNDGDWRPRRLVAIAATGVMMCATRYVYLPLLIAGMAVVLTPAARRIRIAGVQLAVAVVAGLAAIGWLASIHALAGNARAGTDAGHQLAMVLADPWGFVMLALETLRHDALFLFKSTIGVLGWTNLHLPRWTYAALALAFPLSVLASVDAPLRLRWPVFGWFILLILGSLLLIELGLLMVWTRIDSPWIEGVVGRYLLPFLPWLGAIAASLTAPWRRGRGAGLAYAALLAILTATSVVTVIRTIDFYGVF